MANEVKAAEAAKAKYRVSKLGDLLFDGANGKALRATPGQTVELTAQQAKEAGAAVTPV